MPPHDESQASKRFGHLTQEYIQSDVHASGTEFERMRELAAPQPDWTMLDVATGGGHTARAFAPHVRRVVASDVNTTMLAAARGFLQEAAVDNVRFAASDGERLAFAVNSFDLATCRYAPHHFPDPFRFFQEVARVLKPGGVFALHDHLLPDDERAARYVDAFEKLRDPSHVRSFAEYEWRGMFLDAGLTVEHSEPISRIADFDPWVARQGRSPQVKIRLEVLLAQAPEIVAEWLQPRCTGTPQATFLHRNILMMGRKPG